MNRNPEAATKTRSPHKVATRLAMIAVAGLAMLASLSVASPAGATTFTTYGPAGRTDTTAQCYAKTMLFQPVSAAEANATGGQWISYRIAIYDYTAKAYVFTSAWQTSVAAPYSILRSGSPVITPQVNLTSMTVNGLSGNRQMTAMIQVARLRSTGWVYEGWANTTHYQGMGNAPRTSCYT